MGKQKNFFFKRRVSYSGNSLSLNLGIPLKKLGIKRGDSVWIMCNRSVISIAKDKSVLNSFSKPHNLSEEVWRDFLSALLKLYGRKFVMDDEKVAKKLEEALKMWIKKKTSVWEKPIIVLK